MYNSQEDASITAQTPLLSGNNKYSNKSQYKMKYLTCGRSLHLTDRKLLMDLLSVMFGVAAWVAVNGMFVQLPLLVETLPEAWNLPSFLSVIVQIGNIGPISYSISQKLFPNKIKDNIFIYVVLIFGCTALFLMAFLYEKTVPILGEQHSIALFALAFFISVVGCTSSVLFMPYMSNFREIYLISYFIGEGFSGLLPSVIALIQGVGGNPICVNGTITDKYGNTTFEIVPYTPPPRFSSQIFFLILFGFLTASTISFFLMNNIELCKNEKIKSAHTSHVRTCSESTDRISEDSAVNSFSEKAGTENVTLNEYHEDTVNYGARTRNQRNLSSSSDIYLLVIAAWVCALGNGVFPSIQSYSCLPYGNIAYHLAVTLGSMANPLACFISFFYPYTSPKIIVYLTILSSGFSVYIATTAIMSPSPPLVSTVSGELVVVLSWIFFTGLVSYVKVSIASVFRQKSQRALFWCGASQQIGSAVGAIVIFFIVNYANIFQPYYPCS